MATGHPKIIVFIRNALGVFFTALGNFSFSLFLNVTKNKKLEAYIHSVLHPFSAF